MTQQAPAPPVHWAMRRWLVSMAVLTVQGSGVNAAASIQSTGALFRIEGHKPQRVIIACGEEIDHRYPLKTKMGRALAGVDRVLTPGQIGQLLRCTSRLAPEAIIPHPGQRMYPDGGVMSSMRQTLFPMSGVCASVLGGLGVAGEVPQRPQDVDQVMAEASPQRLRATIDRLVSFGTRHTLSDTESNERGIGAARRWLRDQLQAVADESGRDDITVELMRHEQPSRRKGRDPIGIVNVVMTIPGLMPESAQRRFVVLGHYDSRAGRGSDTTSDAPGANDDGSGTALVLELARVFAARRCEATVVFLMTAGEEQGLYGARWYARTARDNGWDIRAALSNDIVGDPTGPGGRNDRNRVRVFSEALPRDPTEQEIRRIRMVGRENDSTSRQLARYIADIAERHDTAVKPWLIYRGDRFLRGGDHSAFNDQGYAAVRFTEVRENYDRQHRDVILSDGKPYGDVAEYVDEHYLADVTRLNGAVLFSLANAPSAPTRARLLTSGLRNDTTLRWAPNPEPDIAGYEVLYRDTTSPRWEHVIDVGDVTEHTVDLSKDNWFFGVRAYDNDGHRSLVSFPSAGRE